MAKVVWFDIPVTDMSRAVDFYQAVTGQELMRLAVAGSKETAIFAQDEDGSGGCLFMAPEDTPSHFKSRVYFDAGSDLDAWLERVMGAGGQVLVPKTPVQGNRGYYAYFEDSEGNRVGLHASG